MEMCKNCAIICKQPFAITSKHPKHWNSLFLGNWEFSFFMKKINQQPLLITKQPFLKQEGRQKGSHSLGNKIIQRKHSSGSQGTYGIFFFPVATLSPTCQIPMACSLRANMDDCHDHSLVVRPRKPGVAEVRMEDDSAYCWQLI